MEIDKSESKLKTYYLEMPENFEDPDLWQNFIDARVTANPRMDTLKQEIEAKMVLRFVQARDAAVDEEEIMKSRNDLLVWLTMYDFSLARKKVTKALWGVQTYLFGDDCLMSIIAPVDELTRSVKINHKTLAIDPCKELSSNSLIKALYKFNPEKAPLDIFIIKYIRGAVNMMKAEFYNPGSTREPARRYLREKKNFEEKKNREPRDDEELADSCGVTPKTVRKWREAFNFENSQKEIDDESLYPESNLGVHLSGGSFGDSTAMSYKLTPEDSLAKKQEQMAMLDAIYTAITKKERLVLIAYYYEELSHKEIFAKYPEVRSEGNSRKLLERALKKMKLFMKE